MMSILFRQRIKVILNALQYLLSLALAEFFSEPFHWIAVRFRVVTAAFAVTKGNNIGRDSSGTSRVVQRNPVIHGNGVPKTSGATTNSTPTTKIVKATLPINLGKGIRETKFESAPAVLTMPLCFRMITTVGGGVFLYLPGMFSAIGDSLFLFLLTMFPVISGTAFFSVFRMFTAKRISTILYLIRMPLPIESCRFIDSFANSIPVNARIIAMVVSYVLPVIFCPSFLLIGSPLAIAFLPFSIFLSNTIYAIRSEPTRIVSLKEFGWQQGAFAFGTVFEGEGNIQHDNLLKSSPSIGGGPALGNAVVRRVITPSQAQLYYTTGFAI